MGSTSTFYFQVVSPLAMSSALPALDDPNITRLIGGIHYGHTLGLHGSYDSWRSSAVLRGSSTLASGLSWPRE